MLADLGYPLYNAYLPYLQAIRGAKFGTGSTYITCRNSLHHRNAGCSRRADWWCNGRAPALWPQRHAGVIDCPHWRFLYASTTATTSNALLGWQCAYNFVSNIMYVVLYAYTPEIFPTKDRRTGNVSAAGPGERRKAWAKTD
jgi:hypothetical protein